MSKTKIKTFHWPRGWHSRQVPYSHKEFEVRFDGRYVLTVRTELAEQTVAWLVERFSTGIHVAKEVDQPEWE